ncbi:hypothetical protein [Candidatus Nitrospira bockiana]
MAAFAARGALAAFDGAFFGVFFLAAGFFGAALFDAVFLAVVFFAEVFFAVFRFVLLFAARAPFLGEPRLVDFFVFAISPSSSVTEPQR